MGSEVEGREGKGREEEGKGREGRGGVVTHVIHVDERVSLSGIIEERVVLLDESLSYSLVDRVQRRHTVHSGGSAHGLHHETTFV